jgi:hypothetical protein
VRVEAPDWLGLFGTHLGFAKARLVSVLDTSELAVYDHICGSACHGEGVLLPAANGTGETLLVDKRHVSAASIEGNSGSTLYLDTMLRHAGRAVRRSQGVVGRGQVSAAAATSAPTAAVERNPAPEAGQEAARQPRWLAELGVVRNDWTCVPRQWVSLGLPGESSHFPAVFSHRAACSLPAAACLDTRGTVSHPTRR